MGEQSSPQIKIDWVQDDDETVCSVWDNGIGIDPRYHRKIFGLFDQLSQQTEGTGIGLSIVKRIVEVHSGRVWVESEGVGKGSSFFFAIPKKPTVNRGDKP